MLEIHHHTAFSTFDAPDTRSYSLQHSLHIRYIERLPAFPILVILLVARRSLPITNLDLLVHSRRVHRWRCQALAWIISHAESWLQLP